VIDRARLARLQGALLARAQVAAPANWLPVFLGDIRIGVSSLEVAAFLSTHELRCLRSDDRLLIDDTGFDFATRSALLFEVASRLRDAGLLRGWRDEALDVRPLSGGAPLARIERSACRALGIATHAVHMNAFDTEGNLVVARRADNKPIDPGLWDNLVGGMVTAGEDELAALARETREEAGLDLARLQNLTRGSLLREARPVIEGYMIETVQVFDVRLPAGATPHNQDGEVAAIEVRSVGDVLDAIERDEFTLEAALVTIDGLRRRS